MYFPRRKSEYPEIRYLWHFPKAKEGDIKTVAIKTVMDCIKSVAERRAF